MGVCPTVTPLSRYPKALSMSKTTIHIASEAKTHGPKPVTKTLCPRSIEFLPDGSSACKYGAGCSKAHPVNAVAAINQRKLKPTTYAICSGYSVGKCTRADCSFLHVPVIASTYDATPAARKPWGDDDVPNPRAHPKPQGRKPQGRAPVPKPQGKTADTRLVVRHPVSRQTGDIRAKLDALLVKRQAVQAAIDAVGALPALVETIAKIDATISATEVALKTIQDLLGVSLSEFSITAVPDVDGSETASVADDGAGGDDGDVSGAEEGEEA